MKDYTEWTNSIVPVKMPDGSEVMPWSKGSQESHRIRPMVQQNSWWHPPRATQFQVLQPCKGAVYGVMFLVMCWLLCNAGSPPISGAVIRKVLVAVYIWFISLLVVITPSQLLQSYASCLIPSFLEWCFHCSTSLLMLGFFLIPTACPLFWTLAAPYIQWLLLCMLG